MATIINYPFRPTGVPCALNDIESIFTTLEQQKFLLTMMLYHDWLWMTKKPGELPCSIFTADTQSNSKKIGSLIGKLLITFHVPRPAQGFYMCFSNEFWRIERQGNVLAITPKETWNSRRRLGVGVSHGIADLYKAMEQLYIFFIDSGRDAVPPGVLELLKIMVYDSAVRERVCLAERLAGEIAVIVRKEGDPQEVLRRNRTAYKKLLGRCNGGYEFIGHFLSNEIALVYDTRVFAALHSFAPTLKNDSYAREWMFTGGDDVVLGFPKLRGGIPAWPLER